MGNGAPGASTSLNHGLRVPEDSSPMAMTSPPLLGEPVATVVEEQRKQQQENQHTLQPGAILAQTLPVATREMHTLKEVHVERHFPVPIYVDRPVYIERPVYVDRPIPWPWTVPMSINVALPHINLPAPQLAVPQIQYNQSVNINLMLLPAPADLPQITWEPQN